MAYVKIMVAPPGAGKSTYIKTHYPDAYICSADHFHIGDDGVYRWKLENLRKAHATCLKKFVDLVVSPAYVEACTIVVDNTNTSTTEIAPYAALALAYGHELELVYLNTPWEVAAARNIHNVPEATVKQMHDRVERMVKFLPKHWPLKVVNG